MSLKEKLLSELKLALKEKDNIKKNTVQMVRAAVLQVEKDNKTTLDDDDVIEVIAKELKKRRDAIPDFEKSGRQDLIDSLQMEIDYLLTYLPEQLSEEELDKIVKDVIDKLGVTTMREIGKVMKETLPLVKGKADGKRVNSIAKKYLQ